MNNAFWPGLDFVLLDSSSEATSRRAESCRVVGCVVKARWNVSVKQLKLHVLIEPFHGCYQAHERSTAV